MADNTNLIDALQALAHERGIDEFFIIERLEDSLAKSYEKILGLVNQARVTIDRKSGRIYVYELVPVGDYNEEIGDFEEFEEVDITPKDVSRIAAQNAKSVIAGIVRDATRLSIYQEFSDRVGDLITGTVLQETKDFTIIKIRDGVEAELPHFDLNRNPHELNERPNNERYHHNQRLKLYILKVRNPNGDEFHVKGEQSRPTIVVSRTHPDLLRRLFEMEVPEVYDGVVEIKSIAREAGDRSKISVASKQANLDPVGACVGPKGSRVRMVVEELKNERVDIVAYDERPEVYIANALSPARITSVTIDEETHFATVVVTDDQLSLAIGKEGQNARLAARLTGWHIDIKSASFSGEPLNEEAAETEEEEVDETCAYVGESGIRCRNHARPGSKYCGIHANMEEK
jgi:transcription termination/antitermination protein NusA